MRDYENLSFCTWNGNRVKVTVTTRIGNDGKDLLTGVEVNYDVDTTDNFNNLFITINPSTLFSPLLIKLIDVAHREKPEYVEWLEAKKLDLELFGRF